MSEPSPPPLLSIRGLTKDFAGVRAANKVSFDIRAGEIVGFVGKNGAGKSTVIKMLAGALTPDAGAILLDGEEITVGKPQHAQRLGLAFVHQELELFPGLTIAENMLLGQRLPRRGRLLVRWSGVWNESRRLSELLGEQLDPRAPIESLAPAQQRLVLIARALHQRARLVVLDEPSASLTQPEIEQLHAICRRIKARGGAIVYVSHRLEEVMDLTDRTVVMRDGRVVHDGVTSELDHETLVRAITGIAPELVAEHTRVRRRSAAQPDAPVVLDVRGLTHPNGRPREVSFVLRSGEILGIAGLVGSGRTELVRMLFGADRASAGAIVVGETTVNVRRPRDAMGAGIALLPEDRRHQGLILDFGVRANTTLASLGQLATRVPLFPSRRREQRDTAALVERLQIVAPDLERSVRRLSGGNQQKVVLAKWLERGADVFLFDEPTAGIDVRAKDQIYRLMEDLADDGKGIVFVSSEFVELVGVCDRVLVMREGRLVGGLVGDEISEDAIVRLCYRTAVSQVS